MGLTVAIGNALAGLKANQGSLEVISRNISNAGTPGYHKQSLNVIEVGRGDNSYVRTGQVERAFDQTLQSYYSKQVPDTAYANTRASYLDRLQTYLGKPGASGSLDTQFGNLQTSLDALATSPDNYATRAEVIAKAQAMAGTLNSLSNGIQQMRQETETKIATGVNDLNSMLQSLQEANLGLADYGMDQTTRVSMLDQRDRLVAGISEMIDVRVDYHDDGSVALSTRSGASLLDVKRSIFEFQGAGGLTPTSQFNQDDAQSDVGKLTLLTPSGVRIDLVKDGAFKSGTLGALIELRDTTLQEAQRQLDDVAAALAQTFSTTQTKAASITPAPVGSDNAMMLDMDLSKVKRGNDLVVSYSDASGVSKSVKIVNVASPSTPPKSYLDTDGNRVVELNVSDGTAGLTSALNDLSPPIDGAISFATGISGTPPHDSLQILSNNSNVKVNSLTARWTSDNNQGGVGELGLQLFVDSGDKAYTGSLEGQGQKLGFAARITLNTAVINDNKLLVSYDAAAGTGDSKRADYIVNQFKTMRFTSSTPASQDTGGFRLSGTLSDMVSQTVEYQGSSIATALARSDTQTQSLDALTQRMEGEYGVDVNEEVSRLMELQNAYAANARVVSVVQELLDALMQAV
jgi:flagellar hook-associated protein 1 FlgK